VLPESQGGGSLLLPLNRKKRFHGYLHNNTTGSKKRGGKRNHYILLGLIDFQPKVDKVTLGQMGCRDRGGGGEPWVVGRRFGKITGRRVKVICKGPLSQAGRLEIIIF